VQQYRPGTILKPSPGLVYKPGPMGAERNDGFLAVSQQLLRIVGVRWAMPEYMVSGDASNANYASTLVAESPFVKARETDQSFYARAFEGLLWKVLRFEWERGILPQRPWAEIEALIDINTEMPSVASRNPQELANVQAIQITNGLLSKRTAATQAGLDWEQEQQNRAEEGPTQAPAPSIMPVREAEDSYSPPEAARNNARRVLKWRDKHGDAVAGMTQVGWTRASQLASGERLSRETVGRMASFFGRHEKNKAVAPEHKGEPWRDAGYVAWLGWGGDTGAQWAAGIVGNVSESCDCGDCGSVENAGTLQAAIVAALESVSTLPEARAILEGLQQ
jgi:hypothetical protein